MYTFFDGLEEFAKNVSYPIWPNHTILPVPMIWCTRFPHIIFGHRGTQSWMLETPPKYSDSKSKSSPYILHQDSIMDSW
jgi:hypothetical protein